MARPLVLPAAALLGLLLLAPTARAQPPRFRPFNGVSADQFYQSSVARGADQLAQDLAALKADLLAAPLAPQDVRGLTGAANLAAATAAEAGKLARVTADRGRVGQALGGVDTAVAELQKAIARTPNVTPQVAQRLARVSASHQQFAVAVAGGDQPAAAPDQGPRVVARLAEALDHQAEGLRLVAADRLGRGFEQNIEQAVVQFARAARRLHRNLDRSGDMNQAQQDLAVVTARWADVGLAFIYVPNLPAAVRAEAVRVDGTFRKLSAALTPPAPAAPVAPAPPQRPAFTPEPTAVLAVGAGEGGGPRVRVFHDPNGPPVFDFFAYDEAFRGGVRVAVADVNGDGVPDVVTAPGRGMAPPVVRVFDGRDASLLVEFQAWDPNWDGGLNVAAADLTADGRALVAVAPDVGGGPVTRVFDLAAGKEVATVTAFPAHLRGGLRLAFGDVNNDGRPDLLTAPGPCPNPPTVRAFDVGTRQVVSEWVAFDPSWTGGIWVAALGGSVLVGTDAGGPAVLRAFDGPSRRKVAEWAAFPAPFAGGVRVAVVAAPRRPGQVNFVAAAGTGARGSPVRVFSGADARLLDEFAAFADFDGGAFIAGR